ncbi:MAG: AAA family ATPase, partial [Abitibacteriaceae bacterium]|nr:AAA family ATPase [Abditibacteriaceae bacterium]
MIQRVVIRNFKRFGEVTFDLPGHVVLAGPNNTGKTTMLQAIAAWSLALNAWRERNDFGKHRGAYAKQQIIRTEFYAVPIRDFDMLWLEAHHREPVEIEVRGTDGWQVTMEIIRDSSQQVSVRPQKDASADLLHTLDWSPVYIPPMTGLNIEEPVYQRAMLDRLLGLGRPGEIIRNLLTEAHQSDVWPEFQNSIKRLFGFEILPPNARGATIIANYRMREDGPHFDVASAGSGFQQVLMLLAFLYTRPASVLLLDEPDAHLHVILQDAIYSELRSIAVAQNSQLIISTHSEVIINSVEPKELCMLLDRPRLLENEVERSKLVQALRFLTNTDIMLAIDAPGVLYAEGHTDIDILREWAKILDHPLKETLTAHLFWKEKVINQRLGAEGCKARDHFEILKLVKSDIRGVELIDGDDHKGIQQTAFEAGKLQRLRWQRYEIESYLLHPDAIDRFIELKIGPDDISLESKREVRAYFEKQLPGLLTEPLGENLTLEGVKASERIIPSILAAAGIHGIEKRDFYEI